MSKRTAGTPPAPQPNPPEQPAPSDAALAAALAWAANVRQRAARLWHDVIEFRQLSNDPAHPLHAVFATHHITALSSALEHADQAATGLLPAARVDAPDLHTGLRPFGG